MTEHQPTFHETGRGPTGDIFGWIECSCKWRVAGMPSKINDQFQRFLDHAATEIAQLQREAVDYRDVVRYAMQIFNTIRPGDSTLATNIVDWKIKAKDVLYYEPNPPDRCWGKYHSGLSRQGVRVCPRCGACTDTASAPRVPKVGDVVLWHIVGKDPEGIVYHPATVMHVYPYSSSGKKILRLFVMELKGAWVTCSEQGTGPGQWSFREDA